MAAAGRAVVTGAVVAAHLAAAAVEVTAMAMAMRVAVRLLALAAATAEATTAAVAVTAPIGTPAALPRIMNISPGAVTRPSILPAIPARVTDPAWLKHADDPPAS